VGVAREHGARDVPGGAHDHFVPRARLGELRDQRVAIIVPTVMEFRIFQGLGSSAFARC
jgi:hypothetical protein